MVKYLHVDKKAQFFKKGHSQQETSTGGMWIDKLK